MQSDKHPTRQIIYDSSDPKLQWRCMLHMMHKPPNLIATAVMALILMAGTKAPPISIIPFAIGIFAINLAQAKLVVNRRTSGPRRCTSTIDHEGLEDATPDGRKRFGWRQIKNIERSDGDIYFFTLTAAIFVPRSAFVDEGAAVDFFDQAIKLWQASRIQKEGNQKSPPSSMDRGIAPRASVQSDLASADITSAAPGEALLAEDESVWIALEDEHKKENKPKMGQEDSDQNAKPQAKE